jgi:flagellar hook-length control protein FliK
VFKAGDHDGLPGVIVRPLPGVYKTSSGKVGVKTERSGRKGESAVSASQVSAPDGATEGSEKTAGRVDGGGAKGFKDSSASFREQVERLEGFGTETQAKSTRFQVDAKTASPQNSCDLPGNQGLLVEAKESLSAAAKETTSRPVSTQAVIDKIAENGQLLLRAGSGRVRLTLSPPQLGTLDVDLRVSRDRLKMVLTAENGEVRRILQSNMDQLKSTLQGQGWNLERMDVVVQDQYGKDLGQPDQGGRSFGGNDPGQSWGDGGRGSGYSMESDDSPFLSGDGILNVFV